MLSAIQDLSAFPLFVQFLFTSVDQILLTYCIVINGFSDKMQCFIYVIHLLGITVELLCPCYFGNMLIESGEELERAIYDSNWYEQNIKFKKLLHVFLIRAQRETSLKAGHWIAVNLYSFGESLKKVYSFATFLAKFK